MLLIYTSRSQ